MGEFAGVSWAGAVEGVRIGMMRMMMGRECILFCFYWQFGFEFNGGFYD